MQPGWRRTVPALFLLALAVRGIAAAGLAVIPRDGTVYVRIARAVFADGPAAAFQDRHHPLYFLVSGALGGSELAATLVAIVGGAVGTLALFRIGIHLHSRALGVLAALLYAVAPSVVRFQCAPLMEGLFLPLYLFAIERGLAARDRWPNGLWAGLLGGAAYLTRPEGLEILAVLPVGLVILRRYRAALLLLLGFLAVGGPYAAWLTREAGTMTVSRKKPVGRFLEAEEGFDAHMAEKGKRTGLERPSFGAALAETGRTLGEAASWILLPLAVAGAILLLRGRGKSGPLLLLALLAVDLAIRLRLLHLHGYLSRRHLLPAVCILLPFAAAGIGMLARRWTAHAAVVLVAVFLVLAVRPRDERKAPLREAGRWIRARDPSGPVVATFRSPRIPYYAGGTDLEIQRLAPDFDLPETDWVALLPARLPEEVRDHLLRTLGPPEMEIGEGSYRVHIWRGR